MRVLVVAEGAHELGDDNDGLGGALEVMVKRLVNTTLDVERRSVKDPQVRRLHGKGRRLFKRAIGWVHWARSHGFHALVFLVDEDQDGDRVRQVDDAQNDVRFDLPRAMGVAIVTFDAWMIADHQAAGVVLGEELDMSPEPESIRRPKQWFVDNWLRPAATSMRQRDVYRQIAERLDLAILKRRCPRGFAPFAERVAIALDHR